MDVEAKKGGRSGAEARIRENRTVHSHSRDAPPTVSTSPIRIRVMKILWKRPEVC